MNLSAAKSSVFENISNFKRLANLIATVQSQVVVMEILKMSLFKIDFLLSMKLAWQLTTVPVSALSHLCKSKPIFFFNLKYFDCIATV